MNSLIIWSKASRKRATALYGFFIVLLTLLCTNCGIPTVVYLEAPDKIGTVNDGVDFYNAYTNDPDVFLGYEIFYCISDSTRDDWESYAETYLTNSTIGNPGSSLMEYSYGYSGLSHNFRRLFAGETSDTSDSEYINVMIPVDPSTVSTTGGEKVRFTIERDTADTDKLSITARSYDNSTLRNIMAAPESSLYNDNTRTLYRKVYTSSSDKPTVKEKFFDIAASDDDCSVSTGQAIYIAFFVVTTGFDIGEGHLVSDITYIGSMDGTVN
ncbi:hypothetical protein [Sediminispirochaeta smaragdinae]|uniref:Uncharacterized protein n=1 Tax=Sediminispirochaeta smaragdinae (strain DSM 11293 / JCM 15392 / SEBR 4228) TaxID=573413 RepID=E1R2Z6_SEDSS|nr:hypothetical protein [Sediminispirochaeta smaragdinae]ADK81182.1 hypothetical protein Spirs_2060 [Sediminispirochaeta smaragdinae DSM 11293]